MRLGTLVTGWLAGFSLLTLVVISLNLIVWIGAAVAVGWLIEMVTAIDVPFITATVLA